MRTYKLALYDAHGGRQSTWTLHCDETSDLVLDELGQAINDALAVIEDEGRGITVESD